MITEAHETSGIGLASSHRNYGQFTLFTLGAFQVLQLVRETGLKPDCKLYTTLISTCAKAGKVDTMFEVSIAIVISLEKLLYL